MENIAGKYKNLYLNNGVVKGSGCGFVFLRELKKLLVMLPAVRFGLLIVCSFF